MRKITDNKGQTLAILLRNDYVPKQTEFYTEQSYSQQLGIIKYAKGHKIKPHFHNPVERSVIYTQEVLIIRKGVVKAFIYDQNLKLIEEVIMHKGDVILLATGGHGFEMIDDAEMIEVKQGPYNGVMNDKTHFDFNN